MSPFNFSMNPIDLTAQRRDLSLEAETARQLLGEATRACYEARPIPLTPFELRWNRLQALALFSLVMGGVGIVEFQVYLYSLNHPLHVADKICAVAALIIGFLIACLFGWMTLTDVKQPWTVRYLRQSVPSHVIWSDVRAPSLANLYHEIATWNVDVAAYNERLRQWHRGELKFDDIEAEIRVMKARRIALDERIEFNAHQLRFGRPLGQFTDPQQPVVIR